ncbi:zinc-binding protein A33-like [Chiloscyllium plagiosum]|uniref:zinc-binding protein A33-like n=1 Tax=Chiloscyllium plagiosum TaxID=36176 RepID=UPI001CB841BD|nr:zinc-binding protein A33-like [Chiloscyllium plagiosum]
MDSRQQGESWMEDLNCSICLDFFTVPVTLECGHNFCRSCITQSWEKREMKSCPECRQGFLEVNFRVNRVLANLAEKARKLDLNPQEKERERHCEEHQEELKLFCETDKKLICVICRDSREHKSHSFLPIKEAVGMYKEELRTFLKPIEDKKEECNTVMRDYEKTLMHILDQGVKTEKQIKAEFGKLHQFLREEEKILLEDLKMEKENKSQEMEEMTKKITEEITSLSVIVQDIEQGLREQDSITFLTKILESKERVKQTLPEPQKVYPLINVGKYIGSLQYRVWKKMLTVINTAPITLDSNTAHPDLLLSEDLSTVSCNGKQQQLPRNPERFVRSVQVLALEGFTSGKHSWEVEVGNQTEWAAGVVNESINRKEAFSLIPGNGYWSVKLRDGNKNRTGDTSSKRSEPGVNMKKIRVCLDYEGGKVSFYNSENKTHIYTFTGTFTEKLYPFFSSSLTDGSKNTDPLTICPRRVTIQEDEGFVPIFKQNSCKEVPKIPKHH